ncbi:MAG: DUF1320 domain-containing protein [Mesorhizobium sp.]|nr:DUF1320 domain-containing protein [Mesorhizobium sp.]MBN9243382.1 DUF1320 domain-containing protein [Mesorhizobium sp.]
MTYASLSDLVERAGEIEILDTADRDHDGIADADVIQAALEAADEAINGYLAVRFRLPLTTVAPVVQRWAVSIARYHLHRNGPPDYVVRDYRDAFAELEKAVAGKLNVPGADGTTPAASSGGATVSEGPEPAFTRDKLGGWL